LYFAKRVVKGFDRRSSYKNQSAPLRPVAPKNEEFP
jgi:hypothetical protein